MEGSIDEREASIRRPAKRGTDLDALRSEVRGLEQRLRVGKAGMQARQREAEARAAAAAPRAFLPPLLGPSTSDTKYSYADALSKRKKLQNDVLAQQRAVAPSSDLNLALGTLDAPLPMVADSVFRDGLCSVLIGEGWTADQALAALIVTQAQGTLAAARVWLKTVLRGGSAVTESVAKHGAATTKTSQQMRDEVLPMSAFRAPPLPPARPSWGSAKSSPSGRPLSPMRRGSVGVADGSPQGDSVARALMMTTGQLLLPPLSGGGGGGGSLAAAAAAAQREADQLAQVIRVRIRRPTDGRTIELRRRFCSRDLLSSVAMTFLSEQGEDATHSASPDDSERAAHFARLVSSTASTWVLVSTSPPKRAYDWTAMDHTSLADAGVAALGGLFAMQRASSVKASWRATS
jgi:hypothetical protein